MTRAHDPLLAAILAAPADDATRLVYADALQTAGDARGELIAVQCELARLGCGPSERLFLEWVGDALAEGDPAHMAKLRKREKALLDAHGATWAAEVLPGVPAARVSFWRGFADRVVWDVASKAAFASVAPITSVMPTSAKTARALSAFLDLPSMARVSELYNGAVLEVGLQPFAAATLPGLRRLVLSHAGGPHELDLLPRAAWLSQLTGLVLNGFALADHDLAPLLSPTVVLEELQLVDTRLGAAGLAKLAALPAIGKLRILAVRHGRLGAGTATPLLERQDLGAGLLALDLRTNALGAADTKLLGAGFPSLRVLDLGNNPLDAVAVTQLATGKGLRSLRTLGLQKSAIDDNTLRTLVTARWMKHLTALDLRKNAISDAGAKVLVGAKGISALRTLYLGGNRLSAAAKKALKSAPSLASARLYL